MRNRLVQTISTLLHRPTLIAAMFLAIELSAPVSYGKNLTLLVTSDVHFGYNSSESLNAANVNALNTVGATIAKATPAGVLVTGDLTHNGTAAQWKSFTTYYPVNGGKGKGVVHYPVFECTGNHDREAASAPVLAGVANRHGNLAYSVNLDGVHLVSMDLYPSKARTEWLAKDLATVDAKTPVVIMSHYGYTSGHLATWDNGAAESQAFKKTITGYNVVALIHGHGHTPCHYQWEGYDVYETGSSMAAGTANSLGLLTITDEKLAWAEYHWTVDGAVSLEWTHNKAISTPEPSMLALLLILATVGLPVYRWRRRVHIPRSPA